MPKAMNERIPASGERFRRSLLVGSGRKKSHKLGIFSKYCTPTLEFLIGKNFDDVITRPNVAEELGITGSRAHEALGSLRRAHLVRSKKVKTSMLRDELAKKKERIYELTLNGLVCILTERPKNWKRIGEVAQRQPEMFPPIFKNWSSFKKHGVVRTVTRGLRTTFESRRELIRVKYWFPPRYKKYLLKRPVLTEMDVRWFEVFHPEYLEKVGKFKKLSDEEEQELEEQMIENEAELKKLLTVEFIKTLFLPDTYLPSVHGAEIEKMFRAFNSSPELREFLEKVLEFFKLLYSARLAHTNALERACSERDAKALKEGDLAASNFLERVFPALVEVWRTIERESQH